MRIQKRFQKKEMIIFLIGGASFDKYLPEDADSNITSGLIYGTFLEGLGKSGWDYLGLTNSSTVGYLRYKYKYHVYYG